MAICGLLQSTSQNEEFFISNLRLSNDFRIIQDWLHKNLMVLNGKKCHYMCVTIGSENDDFIFDGIKLPNNSEQKIFCVLIMSLNLINILGVCVKKQRKN